VKIPASFSMPRRLRAAEKGQESYDRGGPGQRAEPEQQTQGMALFPEGLSSIFVSHVISA